MRMANEASPEQRIGELEARMKCVARGAHTYNGVAAIQITGWSSSDPRHTSLRIRQVCACCREVKENTYDVGNRKDLRRFAKAIAQLHPIYGE